MLWSLPPGGRPAVRAKKVARPGPRPAAANSARVPFPPGACMNTCASTAAASASAEARAGTGRFIWRHVAAAVRAVTGVARHRRPARRRGSNRLG